MIDIIVKSVGAQEILAIVDDLKKNGFKIHEQFDFEYHASNFDEFSGDASFNRYTKFRFYDEHLASWFALRNGQYL